MKIKNGFTLIELLAVIVILAIIAVIAVPIVIDIIEDSKKNSNLRSAEFYLDAVEMSVAGATLKDKNIPDGTYNIMSDGNICLETYNSTTKTCVDKNNDKNIDELVVEVNGEHPKEGTIVIKGGNIIGLNIILNQKEIYKNSKNEMVYVKLLDEVCMYVKEDNTTPKTAGAKYSCKVDPNKDAYTFYVLTTPSSTDESINLIMDQNINSDGTPAGMTGITKNGDNVYNLVGWISSLEYGCDESYCAKNDKGPITAMKFLQEATKNWTNTNEMTINTYTDETGTPVKEMETFNTYARMPIYLSDAEKTEVTNKTNASYLYDNLDPDGKSAPKGYWALSSKADNPGRAWRVLYDRSVGYCYVDYIDLLGVRPVINLKI